MSKQLATHYPQHLKTVLARADHALERGGFDTLLIPSGIDKYKLFDDMSYPFAVNPQFKAWLPLTSHPYCWIAYTPGSKPILVYYQPDDFWHVPPTAPSGYWVDHFDIQVIRSPKEARALLPKRGRCAIVGEADAGLEGFAINNPKAVIASLDYARSKKTAYELEAMRMASAKAVRGHQVAEQMFHQRASEFEIHQAYCAAVGHNEKYLPYGNIIGLNENGAILHYQYQSMQKPKQHRSLLIDAGAQAHGYAADITRTYSNGDKQFQELIDAVDGVQQAICERVVAGQNYPQLHIACHYALAHVLRDLDIVRMSPEDQVECGITSAFYPHGLGHFLGLQVHDVAGFMADESGKIIAKPAGHQYLRLTRSLEVDHVLTIEPGIYFIDAFLNPLRSGAHAKQFNWRKVDYLTRFGGVRIEDNVRVTSSVPENFTRDQFVSLQH